MKKVLFFVVGLVFFISSCTFDECTSKSLYMTSFDNFIEKIEKKHNDYKKEDWKKADERFKKLTEECYKKFEDEFTDKDKRMIVKNGMKYTLYRVKSELPLDFNFESKEWDGFFDDVNKFIDKEKDFTKLFKKLKEDKDFKKAADNFKKGMESLGKGLDKFGKELDKMFEEFNKKDK